MRLNLGVQDTPYSNKPEETTGAIAEILEEKYNVMQIFFDLHEKDIAKDLEDGIAGALENAFAGGKVNLFAEAMGKTEDRFRKYLDYQEHGISLKKMLAPKAGPRHKMQYKKVEKTTAFISTGLYRLNMKAWITE
ncbi:MAG TPA: hypothetical protein VFM18_09110 [Methanosarcina sp.]|nr:hypothetical protein [Methanosarcina sp.]